MINDKLFGRILLAPATELGCDRVHILSGYASPAMANNHLVQLPGNVKVDLVVGMLPKDGISLGAHAGLKALSADNPGKFNCRYVVESPPVHVKTYIWLKDGSPTLAFTGSGNYSQSAFFGGTIESFAEDDPHLCEELYQRIGSGAINCLAEGIEGRINLYKESYKKDTHELVQTSAVGTEVVTKSFDEGNCVTLSLLNSRTGKTHEKSGLNWGQRSGRDHNQAYIPIPSEIARSGFFPARAFHFTIVTDDGKSFDCSVAQDGDKALETPRSNSILGKYFRDRLGLASGAYVNRADLENYGRTDVTICRIDDETFFLDFSVG